MTDRDPREADFFTVEWDDYTHHNGKHFALIVTITNVDGTSIPMRVKDLPRVVELMQELCPREVRCVGPDADDLRAVLRLEDLGAGLH